MKQLLLRVDDGLHAKLTALAKSRGISLNSLANQILGVEIDAAALGPRDRVRLQLMAIGILGRRRDSALNFTEVSDDEWRARVAEASEQIGASDWMDELIAEQRGLV